MPYIQVSSPIKADDLVTPVYHKPGQIVGAFVRDAALILIVEYAELCFTEVAHKAPPILTHLH